MKKIIFAGIGLSLMGVIVYASGGMFNVDNIEVKSTANNATESQKKVTASEFNTVVNTVRGIFSQKNGANNYEVGLNTSPAGGVDLKVGGVLRIGENGIICDSNNKGVVKFSTNDKHFWGCTGSNWKRLDYAECVTIDGVCDTNTEYACTAGTPSNKNENKTQYLWDCLGSNGGADISCTKNKPAVDGVCNNTTINACSTGTFNDIADDSKFYKWECLGSNGGKTDSCSKSKSGLALVYTCGVKGWKYTGKDITTQECYKAGISYDIKKNYIIKDEICSTYIPSDKNCINK